MRFRYLLATLMVTSLAIPNAHADLSVTGATGEKLSIPANTFNKATVVTVTGSRFDETVGIYLAYCVLPKTGAAPTPCGGGANKKGIGDASF